MVTFNKSPEGQREYQKIGKAYPRRHTDRTYEDFLAATSGSPAEFNQDNVLKLTRVITRNGEFLTYTVEQIRRSTNGTMLDYPLVDMGTYPIPIPRNQVLVDSQLQQHVTPTEILEEKIGYSIPFDVNSDKVQNILKLCNNNGKETKYRIDNQITGKNFGIPDFIDNKQDIFLTAKADQLKQVKGLEVLDRDISQRKALAKQQEEKEQEQTLLNEESKIKTNESEKEPKTKTKK